MAHNTTAKTTAATVGASPFRINVSAAESPNAGASAEIFIYGDIGESWWSETISAQQFVKDLAALGNLDALTVRINSFGGSVPDGIAIYNALKRAKCAVHVVIDGVAMSVATLIAMAGNTVEMAENAIFMVHAPWTSVVGNSAEMRTAADMLDQFAAAMATSYAAKTGKTAEEIMALLCDGQDHYYTAAEAQAFGYVDQVGQATTPTMAGAQTLIAGMQRHGYKPGAPAQTVPPAPAAAAQAPTAAPAASLQPKEATTMTQQVNPTAAGATQTAADIDASAIRAQALAEDAARRSAIHAAFDKFAATPGVIQLRDAAAADHSVSVEAASQRLLAHLAAGAESVHGAAGAPRIQTVEDERDKRVEAMSQAILARANAVDEKGRRIVADGANTFRGRRLLAIAEACLARTGVRTEGMDQRHIVGLAFTQGTSDFPVLLENVMRKTLQSAYAVQPDTWTLFCASGTVSDFRAHNRYRVGSLSNLESKTELGEFRNKTIPDGEKSSISVGTKGNIINISREAVINDDLAAITGMSAALGRAAKRTVEADVYATLALNSGMGPTLSDGYSLFHANHNNVGTGAPSVTAFEAGRVAMRAQRDVSGNDFLELSPAIWLGPDAIVGSAKVVNNSTYDPDTANKLQRTNIAAGMVGSIVGTPRLSSTPWYFFAEPGAAPVIEVAFLDGNDTPFLEMENGFTVDGARWKVRLDYGVAGIDYRGAFRSTGA